MEERKEEGEAEIQEHGPEHWFSKWERQCLAEAEQDEQLPPELQEEAAAAAQPEHKQQKLWHLFQNSATAVAQLYKGEAAAAILVPLGRPRPGPALSARLPLRGAATAAAPGVPSGGAAALPPPPRKMAPWEGGPGLGGQARAGVGGAPLCGRPRVPALRARPPGVPLGRERGGEEPPSQNGEGRRRGGPIVP